MRTVDDQNVRTYHRTFIGKLANKLDATGVNDVACKPAVPERDAAHADLLAYLAAHGIR